MVISLNRVSLLGAPAPYSGSIRSNMIISLDHVALLVALSPRTLVQTDCRAGKIVYILVATLQQSVNLLVAKFDKLVAKNTIDNITYHDFRKNSWSPKWPPKIESQLPQTNRRSPNSPWRPDFSRPVTGRSIMKLTKYLLVHTENCFVPVT